MENVEQDQVILKEYDSDSTYRYAPLILVPVIVYQY